MAPTNVKFDLSFKPLAQLVSAEYLDINEMKMTFVHYNIFTH